MALTEAIGYAATLGGFGGLAALVSSLAAWRTSKGAKDSANRAETASARVQAEFLPDHGNSLRDRIDGIDRRTELLAEEVTILAKSVDQTNDLMRDRLKAHDRELKALHEERADR